jgi:hypothetical protein
MLKAAGLKRWILALVYEFVFKKIDKKACTFAARFMNADESPIPERSGAILFKQMQQMARQLKGIVKRWKDHHLIIHM